MATVAIVGTHGWLAKPIVNALLSEKYIPKIQTPIRLVSTNTNDKIIDSDKVEYFNSKESPLIEAFKGFDVVINLVNIPGGPLDEILEAVIANKTKLYIPSQFGCDLDAVKIDFPGFIGVKIEHSDAARAAGIKTVDIATTFFYDGDNFIGFPIPYYQVEGNTVEIVGDENIQVQFSYYQDIGEVVAICATASDFSKLPNKCRIYSDTTTVGKLVEKYEKKHNVKLKRAYKDFDAYYNAIKEKHAVNGTDWNDFLTYLTAIQGAGDGKGAVFTSANEREVVNPNESLFKWTRFG